MINIIPTCLIKRDIFLVISFYDNKMKIIKKKIPAPTRKKTTVLNSIKHIFYMLLNFKYNWDLNSFIRIWIMELEHKWIT